MTEFPWTLTGDPRELYIAVCLAVIMLARIASTPEPDMIVKAAFLAVGLAGLGLGIRFVSLCIGRGWLDRT